MFTKGQLITGLPISDIKYGFTTSKAIMKVVIPLITTGEFAGCMRVKVIKHSRYSSSIGGIYHIIPKHFKLYHQPIIKEL